MITARRLPAVAAPRNAIATLSLAASQSSQLSRSTTYRRLTQHKNTFPSLLAHQPSPFAPLAALSSNVALRSIHTTPRLQQQAQAQKQPQDEVKDPPRPDGDSSANSETKSEQSEKEGDGGKEEQKNKKDDLPPPPPHGDKTPWQVFRETWSNELKASKEWNESTKQLAGEVQEFRESEGLKKARAAYDATGGRATRVAGDALKGTAKVVGASAAWTWETGAVQGLRKGVNATGRGIEQATRPIRESETFKTVSEAIDDGNSSRYGGWTEKEERRRRREMLDKKAGSPGQKVEEDPK